MNTHTSLGRRIVAALGAAAIGLVGLAGAANADDHTTTTDTGNIDFSQPRSIVVHKYSQPDAPGSPATGEEQIPGDGAKAIDGVIFQACKVLNLGAGDTDNWQKVDKATVNEQGQVTIDGEPVTPESDVCVTQETVGGGKATFSGLDAALYVITETGIGTNPIAEKSAPFLVTVPMPNADKSGWLYKVHAYPKNVLVGKPTKIVDDSGAHIDGDVVTWTITATVPNLIAGKTLTKLAIEDELDDRLELVGDAAVTVMVNGEAFNDFSLETTTPFTVKFTKPGDFKGGEPIVVTVKTKVNFPAGTETGKISNTATLIVNDAEVPSEPATTEWGTLRVSKTDVTNKNPLSGAEFKVCLRNDDCGTPVKTFTSDTDGNASLALKAGTYYLVETKAPAGYTLDSKPRKVVVKAGTAADATVEGITNTKQSVPALPLTGANGQLLALIGGGALVLLAGGTALVARKRSHQKQD